MPLFRPQHRVDASLRTVNIWKVASRRPVLSMMLTSLLVAAVMSSCGENVPARSPATTAVMFRQVSTGSIPATGHDEPTAVILRDSANADQMLRSLRLDRTVADVHQVDFTKEAVVVVLAASQADTAYRVDVTHISVVGSRAEIIATVTRPADVLGGATISVPY